VARLLPDWRRRFGVPVKAPGALVWPAVAPIKRKTALLGERSRMTSELIDLLGIAEGVRGGGPLPCYKSRTKPHPLRGRPDKRAFPGAGDCGSCFLLRD